MTDLTVLPPDDETPEPANDVVDETDPDETAAGVEPDGR